MSKAYDDKVGWGTTHTAHRIEFEHMLATGFGVYLLQPVCVTLTDSGGSNYICGRNRDKLVQ